MPSRRIGVIGAGNMGTALLRGILASEWGRKPNLLASHPKKPKAAALARELGIRVVAQNLEVARKADVLILAVKPQILESVLTEIRPALGKGQLLISIAAGFPTQQIESILGAPIPVIRAMPNVAAVVSLSATVLCLGRHAKFSHAAEPSSNFRSISSTPSRGSPEPVLCISSRSSKD